MNFYIVEYEYYDKFEETSWNYSYYELISTDIGIVIEGDCVADITTHNTAESSISWLMRNTESFRNVKLTHIGTV